jgi:signal transduction histidine kinase
MDEAIGFIKTSTAKMDRLIGAILRLSREGRRDFRPEAIDMTVLLEGIADSMTHQAVDAQAELIVEPLPPITSDRLAVEQIFSNLMDNALKYLRPGEAGQVRVSAHPAGPNVAFTVQDNGRGIASQDHQRIFDLFRRAGSQDRPGEGIGLAHVRTLVRRLGGSIKVDSTPGQGSVFTVVLPRFWIMGQEKITS